MAVGPGVSDLRVGDQVYGVTNPQFTGAYAEYALASAAMLSKKPASLTHIEAASVPVTAVTAWQALFDEAQLKAGQTVLIHGAAGNVGAYAVQLARGAGVRTIATAAADDTAFVQSLGADIVIDYHTRRFENEVRDADAVIDLVGGETQERSFKSSVQAASSFRRCPLLISILRKVMESKPHSFWSMSPRTIWRRSPASSKVES